MIYLPLCYSWCCLPYMQTGSTTPGSHFPTFCSTLCKIQVPRPSDGGYTLVGSPQSTLRSSTAASPQDGTSIMLSTPSASTPQFASHQGRSGRGGSPGSRGCLQGRHHRVSIAGGTGPRNGLSTHRESQWYPPTAALQQVHALTLER